MDLDPHVDDVLRPLIPEVLGSLVRRYGAFDACEDAVQEAALAAATQWPVEGLPANPAGWLVRVATRRLTDEWRSDRARRRREVTAAMLAEPVDDPVPDGDDTLILLFLCCHPSLSRPSQIALTLRAVGGLTTGEIAHAFLVPESTMGQRISRAKQRIRASALPFRMPPPEGVPDRLRSLLHVLYLIFNEGYATSSGPDLQRGDLTREAIRLTRAVHGLLPQDGEVSGLLALMLLTDARRAARNRPDGTLIPLDEQDRRLWDPDPIREGTDLITETLRRAPLGPFQLQAAIAAVHLEAPRVEDTDWPQILSLYELLQHFAPSPVVTLNQSIAAAMVHGPHAGLLLLDPLYEDQRMAGHHRLDAVRAHLLEMAGDQPGAREFYQRAALRATNAAEQRYLENQARRLPSAS